MLIIQILLFLILMALCLGVYGIAHINHNSIRIGLDHNKDFTEMVLLLRGIKASVNSPEYQNYVNINKA